MSCFFVSLSPYMAKLHLFNPENDLALALGIENFTPPKAASALHKAGSLLPLWYGQDGDLVIANGVDAHWLESIYTKFGIGAKVYDYRLLEGLEATPWGWSLHSRKCFLNIGYTKDELPDDSDINRWRQMSHRRTAISLHDAIASKLDFEIAPAAVEIFSVSDLKHFLADNPASIIKSPWSSSGRGLIDSRQITVDEITRRCDGIIKRQGSVLAEHAYYRIIDFALLFNCCNRETNFAGISLFETDTTGAYSGNILASNDKLLEIIDEIYPADRIIDVAEYLRCAINDLITPFYSGPLGIDMLVARTPAGGTLLDATVEMNLRMTMGFVSRYFSDNYLLNGKTGRYYVTPENKIPVPDNAIVENRKLISGRINLTPPGGLFRFIVETDK